MSNKCRELHHIFHNLPILSFPFHLERIPPNGIYVLFESGELAHGGYRIVRVGTHTGSRQLPSRISQHFLKENKDRSIFRKNIGRALLNRGNNPFLAQWEIDLTTREAKRRHAGRIDSEKQKTVERQVTEYIQKNFSFALLPVEDKAIRLGLESKMISTLSLCTECGPSEMWLGLYSPKDKICESGLWIVNELYKIPLAEVDLCVIRGFGNSWSASK